ncbi:potassium channel family protein [Vreelandella populi]|uniref:potassium channel family protein n=1 Tax=Vreelandella populi TaxID=2498858 RepID=UPI000F8F1689|nr:potassium channel family protein [Halomonas populi]RUR57269.1 two pore domain potassium channel family protein [Halomonas populi]
MTGSTLAGVIGVLFIALANYDAIRTTLSASHSGPVTNRLISIVWSILLSIHRTRRCHWLLAATGPWITIGLLLVWVITLWLGWLLVFCGGSDAVVNANTQASASLVERIYFTGYTLTTLGYGDFVPGNDRWRLVPTLAAANGFFLFTLSITYMLNIVSNVTQKRHLALSISALGESPLEVLNTTHDNGKFTSLSQQLSPIQQTISILGQQHLAYPILHYYHAGNSQKSLPLALARLYQALVLATIANPDLSATTHTQFTITMRVIDQFLDTLDSAFIRAATHLPPFPALEAYKTLPGFDASQKQMQEGLSEQSQKVLLAYIQKDGWEWEDIWQLAEEKNMP